MKRAQITSWFADEWDGVRDRWAGMTSEKKAVTGLVSFVVIVVLVLAAVFVGRSVVGGGEKIDTEAYRHMLVNPSGGDLPAPDFVGWTAEPRTDPPQLIAGDESITEASPAECVPGGDMHQRAQNILLEEYTNWSGETLRLVAYNARFDVDISNAKQGNMSAIDAWTDACPRTRFVKDGIEHVQRIQTLPLENGRWGMQDSRVYVVTLTRLQDGKNLGTTSTLYAISQQRDLTMQGALTIRGSVDDNALSTLNKLWSRQTTKVKMDLDNAVGDGN